MDEKAKLIDEIIGYIS